MAHSKLKVLFLVSLGLMLLFAPFALEIFPGGETYAMTSWFSQDRSDNGSAGNVRVANSGGTQSTAPVHQTPEPATLLLFGAGAVSLAALRKKFRKK